MLNNILEISKRTSKGGRVPIKIALLKIHEDETETNSNGLHWKEEYVQNAIDSVKMMPICASFCDETKTVPLDHGLTGEYIDENGIHEPLFENSETVGCFENGMIEDVLVDGNKIKALTATGYLFNQRYPSFVKWVRENYSSSRVDTSIEIMGTPLHDNKIVYEEDSPKEDFRTPKEFIFSASCILSVQPADTNAIVLEVAQKNKQNKGEVEKMEINMDEVKEVIQATITELNSKEAELNQVISEKESIISEQNEKIVELNATVEQVQKALDDLKKEYESYWEERAALEKELGNLKAKARLGELNEAIAHFSEEEKKYAESEINNFKEKPMEGDIDVIVSKIFAGIGRASKKAANDSSITEQNSATTVRVEDIFSEMCEETQGEEEDINIF